MPFSIYHDYSLYMVSYIVHLKKFKTPHQLKTPHKQYHYFSRYSISPVVQRKGAQSGRFTIWHDSLPHSCPCLLRPTIRACSALKRCAYVTWTISDSLKQDLLSCSSTTIDSGDNRPGCLQLYLLLIGWKSPRGRLKKREKKEKSLVSCSGRSRPTHGSQTGSSDLK